jgi:quinol monooxygenase YgiN
VSAIPPYRGGPPPHRRDGRHRQPPPPAYPAAPGPVMQGPAGSGAAGSGPVDTRPYGRMVIFTLLDDKVADFDRLAEQTAEQVRVGEPDTFVYVIHTVPGAPLQRIFYEIYRNRAAFQAHEDRPYTQRFLTERRAYVLATNVIELRLKYAKVAPLSAPARPRPAPPSGPMQGPFPPQQQAQQAQPQQAQQQLQPQQQPQPQAQQQSQQQPQHSQPQHPQPQPPYQPRPQGQRAPDRSVPS